MSSELVFRTGELARHGHPEITVRFEKPLPVPGIERMLLGYFENAVAAGTRFLPGQTVQLGWALLRLTERADGTVGVEEMDPDRDGEWVESVDRTLLQTWLQQEVARSVGLEDEMDFPKQHQAAIICRRLLDGSAWLLSRETPDDGEDSGWFFGCSEDDHDHDQVDNLARVQLFAVTCQLRFITQFLALPPKTEVLVEGPGRIRARIRFQGSDRPAEPGSYLASLNDPGA